MFRRPLQEPGPGQLRIRIAASATLGSGVRGWTIGQRVGVGFLGGSSGYCGFCRSGDLINCRNQEQTGIHYDGGYAEAMAAKASGGLSIPNDLSSAHAAPLLCAGLTTFSALRNEATTDYIKGTGRVSVVYYNVTLKDGSTLWWKGSGPAKLEGTTTIFPSAPLSVLGGSGRFEGAKGDGTSNGARLTPLAVGAELYLDVVINVKK